MLKNFFFRLALVEIMAIHFMATAIYASEGIELVEYSSMNYWSSYKTFKKALRNGKISEVCDTFPDVCAARKIGVRLKENERTLLLSSAAEAIPKS